MELWGNGWIVESLTSPKEELVEAHSDFITGRCQRLRKGEVGPGDMLLEDIAGPWPLMLSGPYTASVFSAMPELHVSPLPQAHSQGASYPWAEISESVRQNNACPPKLFATSIFVQVTKRQHKTKQISQNEEIDSFKHEHSYSTDLKKQKLQYFYSLKKKCPQNKSFFS